jgi:hypothetical protein
MPRIRTIKPEFWEDEKVASVPHGARLLFIALWNLADDEGRLRGATALVHRKVFPYDHDAPVAKWLDALVAKGFVRRYSVEGQIYLDIPKFLKHQRIKKPSPSQLPHWTPATSELVPHGFRTDSEELPHQFPTSSPPVPHKLRLEQGTGNRELGKELGREDGGPPDKSEDPPAIPQELRGLDLYEKDAKLCRELPKLLPAWKDCCPGLDIAAEIRRAHSWELEDPTHRKTKRGAFLGNWLRRSQDDLTKGGRNGKQYGPASARGLDAIGSQPGKFDGHPGA